ncbi:MAG: 2-oxoacid:acceptor oxidoreductase family protein, partial [Bauldia litoralis]
MAHDVTKKENRSVSLALTGSGGAGVITAGELLLSAAAGQGYYGLMTRSAGPQIRGGEAAALLTLSVDPVAIHNDEYDLLIGVDWQNVDRFAAEIPMSQDGMVIGDPEGGEAPAFAVETGAGSAEVALQALAKDIPKGRANMIALGIAARLLGLEIEGFSEGIAAKLAEKGPEVIEAQQARGNAERDHVRPALRNVLGQGLQR